MTNAEMRAEKPTARTHNVLAIIDGLRLGSVLTPPKLHIWTHMILIDKDRLNRPADSKYHIFHSFVR